MKSSEFGESPLQMQVFYEGKYYYRRQLLHENGNPSGREGIGKTSPNPMVGAVIVKDGKIIGGAITKDAAITMPR